MTRASSPRGSSNYAALPFWYSQKEAEQEQEQALKNSCCRLRTFLFMFCFGAAFNDPKLSLLGDSFQILRAVGLKDEEFHPCLGAAF